MKKLMVSCIMPTADRHHFIPNAINYFLRQDYKETELIILDTGKASCADILPINPKIRYKYLDQQILLGEKRNMCCIMSSGDIIMHWDDDDWYADDWITKQMHALTRHPGVDITGLRKLNFFYTINNERWEYEDKDDENPWIYGATMAYRKSFWKDHQFPIMNAGEDFYFAKEPGTIIYPHQYSEGYLGIIHSSNQSIKYREDPKHGLKQIKWKLPLEKPEIRINSKRSLGNFATSLVSCIMPTANRHKFIEKSIDNFLSQDYNYKELIILDDGIKSVEDLIPLDDRIKYFYSPSFGTLGSKRNTACELARGEFIVHWDDDDWYAKDWISYQVMMIGESMADICGLDQIQHYWLEGNQYWMTKNYNSKHPWVTGATLIYKKTFWRQHPFKSLHVGEDNDFVRNSGGKIFAHDYYQGFIATIHNDNTNNKNFEANYCNE